VHRQRRLIQGHGGPRGRRRGRQLRQPGQNRREGRRQRLQARRDGRLIARLQGLFQRLGRGGNTLNRQVGRHSPQGVDPQSRLGQIARRQGGAETLNRPGPLPAEVPQQLQEQFPTAREPLEGRRQVNAGERGRQLRA
jgi:hypothetical protein